MSDRVILQQLVSIGLTDREARVYFALLQKDETTATEVHRISGVLRAKSYDILENLVAKGFATERTEGRKKYFKATAPAELKQLLVREINTEREQKLDIADELFTSLSRIHDSISHSTDLDKVEVLRSRNHIRMRYLQFLKETKSSLLSFSRSPYAFSSDKEEDDQEDVQHDLMNAGVIFKTVYMYEDDTIPWLINSIRLCVDRGEQARIAKFVPMKMFISDESRVLFSIENHAHEKDSDFTMLVIDDPSFASSMLTVFNHYWETSQDIEEVVDEF